MEYDLDKDDDDDEGGDIDDDFLKGLGIGKPKDGPPPPPQAKAPQEEVNYRGMAQAELQHRMNQAIDAENFEEAHEISKHLRENFNKIVGENLVEAITMAGGKPGVKEAPPKTKPGVRPGKPSVIPRHRPSVDPRPKATLEDVVKRFVSLVDL